MALIADIRRRARHIVGPFMGICATAYFIYHAIQGDRGLIALWHLRQELRQQESELAAISAERFVIEKRVTLLRPESLDPDMIEERARAVLNVGEKEDLIILLPDKRD